MIFKIIKSINLLKQGWEIFSSESNLQFVEIPNSIFKGQLKLTGSRSKLFSLVGPWSPKVESYHAAQKMARVWVEKKRKGLRHQTPSKCGATPHQFSLFSFAYRVSAARGLLIVHRAFDLQVVLVRCSALCL